MVAIYVVMVGIAIYFVYTDENMLGVLGIIFLLLYIPGIWIGLAVGAKRLHDRNKSAWWLLLFYVLPGVLGGISNLLPGEGAAVIVAALLGFAILGIWIWMIVELGCLRGSIGDNQYGPDPLAPQPAAVRV
jgi:uncharacterized membrane protein YhaH (DUF805 family)